MVRPQRNSVPAQRSPHVDRVAKRPQPGAHVEILNPRRRNRTEDHVRRVVPIAVRWNHVADVLPQRRSQKHPQRGAKIGNGQPHDDAATGAVAGRGRCVYAGRTTGCAVATSWEDRLTRGGLVADPDLSVH